MRSTPYQVIAASGEYSRHLAGNAEEKLPDAIVQSLHQAFLRKQHVFGDGHYVLHFADSHASEALLYVGESGELDEIGQRLMQVFCSNVAIAFENLHLNQELFESQLDMVYLLAGAAELDGLPEELCILGFDPQTAGGLLVSLPAEKGAVLQASFAEAGLSATRIGSVVEGAGLALA